MTEQTPVVEQLQAALGADRYVVVRNFLPPRVTMVAYRYALMKVQNGEFSLSDTQVPNTPAFYGDTLMEVLLESAVPAVERIVGDLLYPTYSYMRVYKRGDRLAPHIDRPSCEVSMTLCLGYNTVGAGDPEFCWPIGVDNSINYSLDPTKASLPSAPGKGKNIYLKPGDGLIYYGTEILHWRDPFPADHQVQLFFHFVRRNGPYAQHKFDQRLSLGAAHNAQRLADPRAQAKSAAVPPATETLTTRKPDALPPGVLVVENFLTEPQTRYLLELSARGQTGAARTGTVKVDGSVSLEQDSSFQATRIELTDELPALRQICDPIFRQVIPRHYGLEIEWYEQPHILSYQPGGQYGMHADSEQQDPATQRWIRGVDRDISLLVYLDMDFEGGALYFPSLGYRLQPRRGMLVCFPSDHRYVHVAEPVTAGVRHVLISWAAARGTSRVHPTPPMKVIRL